MKKTAKKTKKPSTRDLTPRKASDVVGGTMARNVDLQKTAVNNLRG